MEQWTAGNNRPDLMPPEPAPKWRVPLIALSVLAAAVVAYYGYEYWQMRQAQTPPSPVAAAPAPDTAASAPEDAPEPAVRHPVETAPAEAAALPTLDNSDAMMRESLSGLLGRKSFEELVYPAQLVRRIVATVDNLPRKTAPTRVMPVQRVPGAFMIAPSGEEASIGPDNAARYTPYVRVFEALDSRALVKRYVASYPLFQQAYEELGYPNRHFNDRLVQAIDELLAAPEVLTPIKLVQPKVLYQFADPDLEERSAGQKIMIRMGRDNATKVKAKLREIRRELTAAQAAR